MSEQRKKKRKAPRQEWKPHWLLKGLYGIWLAAFSAFKIVIGAMATVLLIAVVCAFVFVGILGDYLQEDILPLADMDIEGYDQEQNSYLYYVDDDGHIQIYQKVFAETSSEWAFYDDIPEDMINAAIAIEDHRFLEHQGVDWVTTIKACARMFFGDSSVGGSSITQQLVKNILLEQDETADDVTVQRKMLEIFRAVQLEKRYDKKTILENYLNVIYLGQGCDGVRSAAATYFGKELEMLTTAECASLISITNNPSLFDPYGEVFLYTPTGEEEPREMSGLERNRDRQQNVLWAMREYGFLTEEEYQKAISQRLILKNGIDDRDRLTQCPNEACGYENIAKNFREEDGVYYCPQCGTLTPTLKDSSQEYYSWFTDTVLVDVAKALAEKNGMEWTGSTQKLILKQIGSAGYHIYTTLDPKVQEQVETIYSDLSQIPAYRGGQQLESAIVVTDNRTGDIVGIAGGVGEKKGYVQFNRATQAQRQTGSSIKPITVYCPAFELGAITPATVITDLPITYEPFPYPNNDTKTYSYSRTIFSGVVSSVNAVAAHTLQTIGEGYAFNFAKEKFGLTSLLESYEMSNGNVQTDQAVGPLALGAQTIGVTVREMTDAFGALSNAGTFRKSRTYTKVYDSEGNLVLDNTQESREILSAKTVDYMNYCLVNATHDGTGYDADLNRWGSVGITTAGKTGTTGENKDRWYCGFTGYYTAAVWCGFNTPEVISGTTGNPAAILWKKVMEPLHAGKSNVALYNRYNMTKVTVCRDSGLLATEACEADIRVTPEGSFTRVAEAMVYPEDKPKEKCEHHVLVDVCPGGGVCTEYCQLFAETDPTLVFEQKGLVKLTQEEIVELLKAEKQRLEPEYLLDNYVYLINKDGTDGIWKGFKGLSNLGVEAPYVVCPLHTKEAWEAYHATIPTVPEETISSETVPAPGTTVTPNPGTTVTPDPGTTAAGG